MQTGLPQEQQQLEDTGGRGGREGFPPTPCHLLRRERLLCLHPWKGSLTEPGFAVSVLQL